MLFFTTRKKARLQNHFVNCPKCNRFLIRQVRDSLCGNCCAIAVEEALMSTTPKNRILIVDDDRSIRSTVAMLLAGKGYEISCAENGFDALLQMKSQVPAL